MTFEPTNREEIILRLSLEEARALLGEAVIPSPPPGEALWGRPNELLRLDKEALLQAIGETELYSSQPKPGDVVHDPRGPLSPCKAGVICAHDGPCHQDCGGDHYYHDAGYCLRCGALSPNGPADVNPGAFSVI